MFGKTFLLAKFTYSSIVQSLIVTMNGEVRTMFIFLAAEGDFLLSLVAVATTHFDSKRVLIKTDILSTLVYLKF
jgi:predicted secreted protein